MSNVRRTVLYVGMTNNLKFRVYQHKNGIVEGFTKKYYLKYLLYYEEYRDINEVINREKQLKNWHRDWKINLIKKKTLNLKI